MERFFALNHYTFTIYKETNNLPKNWDEVAFDNVFLQKSYLSVLEKASATNMQCFFIAIYNNNKLVGVALAQYLNILKLASFGERDKCIKTSVRNFIFKKFASHVLFLGNNMITGQNCYSLIEKISLEEISLLLSMCAKEIILLLKKDNINIHLVSFKDFYENESNKLKQYNFKNHFEFKSQPNMIFAINDRFFSKESYINSFTKKYRDQYKRARKKNEGIIFKELSLDEIILHQEKIYSLYEYVAKNAPFNTFFLEKNHFTIFKTYCEDTFKVFGYFLENKLIGFHTLLLNGNTLETYFLGYDEVYQKEKMLYLNMLYNMVEFAIAHKFGRIIFGRTALEIKSSIGAKPHKMSGFIYHTNAFINKNLDKIFPYLEPEILWQERHPFK